MERNNINTNTVNRKIKTHNGWKIAVAVLVFTLAGTIGVFTFFTIKNNGERNDLKNKVASLQKDEKEECSNTTDIAEQPKGETPEESSPASYLTIESWGVKLKVPDGLNYDMVYYPGTYGDGPETLVDITSKISLGGDDYSAHAYIIRSQNSTFQTQGHKYRQIGKIGGYYYFVDEADLIQGLLVTATLTLTPAN